MEQRKYPRKEIDLEVELSYLDAEPVIVHTRDISEGGLFLIMDSVEKRPVIGELVYVSLVGESANRETLPESAAVVVHQDAMGIGLAYVEMELDD
ncbi:MAG: PilZ domain-containing protein [Gammaproteobacteria bacterium]|nr:PilZ domain-containing protein [Gammaproteobacteria bacterium]MDH5735860.1 PilZ domain-containing protein [Gammaproteobacteria bacterium]